MPNTPMGRSTRSNSNPQNFSYKDIKALIEESTAEILKSVKIDIDGVKSEFKKLNETLSFLVDKVEALDSRTKLLETKVEFLESGGRTMCTKQMPQLFMEDMFQEIEERTRRRKFLIVSGVEELTSGTVFERKKHDTEFLRKLSEEIGVEDFDPKDVRRIGQIGGTRPRLLRFKCSEMEEKRTFLRQAKTLRNSSVFRGIYINPDLTKNQRIKGAELRAELKRRRNEGENVVIHRGRTIINADENQLDFRFRF